MHYNTSSKKPSQRSRRSRSRTRSRYSHGKVSDDYYTGTRRARCPSRSRSPSRSDRSRSGCQEATVSRNSDIGYDEVQEPMFPELWGTFLSDEMISQMEAWRKEAAKHFDYSLLSRGSSKDNTVKGKRKREREEDTPPSKRQRFSPAMHSTIYINRYHPEFKRSCSTLDCDIQSLIEIIGRLSTMFVLRLKCSQCSKTYKTRGGLLRHKKEKHKLTVDSSV